VFAYIVPLINARHHSDTLGPEFDDAIWAEERRHPNIIDFNHVVSKNSTFLWESFIELKKSFNDHHKESYSPIQPVLKTDKAATIMNEELYPK